MKKTILFLTLVSFIFLGSCNKKGRENQAEPTVTQGTSKLPITQTEEEIIKKKLAEVDSTSAEEVHKVLAGLSSEKQAFYIQKYGQRFCNPIYQTSVVIFHNSDSSKDYKEFWKKRPQSTKLLISDLLKLESSTVHCYSHWLAFSKDSNGVIVPNLTDKFINNKDVTSYSFSLFNGLKLKGENSLNFAVFNDGSIIFKGKEIYNYRIDPTFLPDNQFMLTFY